MRKLCVLGSVLFLMGAASGSAWAQSLNQGNPGALSALIENAAKITIKNQKEIDDITGVKRTFAQILALELITGVSSDGSYYQSQISNDCVVSRADKTVSTCTLSIKQDLYHTNPETGAEERVSGGGNESATHIRYQVKTDMKLGKTTRTIVGNAVRIDFAG